MTTKQLLFSTGLLRNKVARWSFFWRHLPLAALLSIGPLAHSQIQWQFQRYDEFNGAKFDNVDTTKWVVANVLPSTQWGSNSDAVTYCSQGSSINQCDPAIQNVYLDGGGHLVIHAQDANHTRSVVDNCPNGVCTYSNQEVYNSGRLESVNDMNHSFRYGRIEARVQVPKGKGAWPAFWLLGSNYAQALHPVTSPQIKKTWPIVGEIDILEQWSMDSSGTTSLYHNQGSIHGPYVNGPFDSQLDQGATSPDAPVQLGDAFHTYAVDWLPGEVDFYIDGALYGRESPALLDPNPNNPNDGDAVWELDAVDQDSSGNDVPRTEYPILNLEMGTVHSGNFYPATDELKLDMVVDYVRHYTSMLASQSLPAFYGDADLGGGGPDTSASWDGVGTYTITGSGNGFDQTTGSSSHFINDQLHYVYRPLKADGTYSVKVSQTASSQGDNAGGGLMIRDGRAASAQLVSIWQGAGTSSTVHFTSRVSSTTSETTKTNAACGPYLRIVKSGTSFTGSCSADGATWTTVGTATVTFSDHELAGLTAFAGGNPVGPAFDDVLHTVTFTNYSTPNGRAAWDGNAPKVPTPPYKGKTHPTLVQAENFDVGGEGVAYHSVSGTNGTAYRKQEMGIVIDTQHCHDFSSTRAPVYDSTGKPTVSGGTNVGCFMVGSTRAGQWMDYTINVTTAGAYTITTRLASGNGGGKYHYELDGTSVGGVTTVPNTGGWDTWTGIQSLSFNLTTGIHTLRLVMDAEGTGGGVANFDLFTISQ